MLPPFHDVLEPKADVRVNLSRVLNTNAAPFLSMIMQYLSAARSLSAEQDACTRDPPSLGCTLDQVDLPHPNCDQVRVVQG